MSDTGSTVPPTTPTRATTGDIHDVNSAKGSQTSVAKTDYRLHNNVGSTPIPAKEWDVRDHGSYVTAIPKQSFREANSLGSTPGSSEGKQ